jgi:prepilin-type N-terminal cleavage/methylation domain-containing protein
MIKNTNKRKAFTIMELMISIVVIGILATLSFKAYDIVIANAKAKKVEKAITSIVASIADAQQFGGILWGGGGNAGTTFADFVPLQNPDTTTCNFNDGINANFCDHESVPQTEQVLYKKLKELGLSVRSDNTFYLSDFPSSSIALIANNNGFHYFIISGVPGDIGAKVYQNLSNNTKITNETLDTTVNANGDGSSTSHPIIVLKHSATILAEAITAITAGQTPQSLFKSPFSDGNTLDTISSYPKVDLVYVYGTTEASW